MSTPSQLNAQALIEAMREMGPFEVKIFTASLIGMMQVMLTPEQFASALAKAKAMTCGFRTNGGVA